MYDIKDPLVWIGLADKSYIATRMLSLTYFMEDAPVLAHRAIELYLKAFLVSEGQFAQKELKSWGHQLDKLRQVCESFDLDFSNTEFARRVAFYQKYFDSFRYPGEDENTFSEEKNYWLGFDSAVLPLDEIVAFARPRIKLTPDDWMFSWLNSVYSSDKPHLGYQKRALIDHNEHLKQIICTESGKSIISFDKEFSLDRPGC